MGGRALTSASRVRGWLLACCSLQVAFDPSDVNSLPTTGAFVYLSFPRGGVVVNWGCGAVLSLQCNPFGVASFQGAPTIVWAPGDNHTLFFHRSPQPTVPCVGFDSVAPDVAFNITLSSEVVTNNPFIPQDLLFSLPTQPAVAGQVRVGVHTLP